MNLPTTFVDKLGAMESNYLCKISKIVHLFHYTQAYIYFFAISIHLKKVKVIPCVDAQSESTILCGRG